MIRFKAGVPRRGPTPTASRVPARAPRRRRPGRFPASRSRETPRGSRLLAVGVPTAWAAAAVAYRLTCPLAHDERLSARLVSSAVLCAIGTGIVLHVRRTLLRELRRARWAAEAAHGVLLRPPPPRVDGLAVAAVQLSADTAARIGGDLYEVVATEHGVRAVIGDVRGHGPAAAGTAATVLGCFREAAHDERDLAGVLRRLERALARRTRARTGEGPDAPSHADPPDEDFVTVLLLEILPDGTTRALNCGHPWPRLLSGTGVEALARTDPLPPLGLFPLPPDLPAVRCAPLLPGTAVLLHTDGAEDARDTDGRFFPLERVLADAARDTPLSPQGVLRTVLAALMRHSDGPPQDDVALLVLTNERPPQPADHAGCAADLSVPRHLSGPRPPPRDVASPGHRPAP
ncbi:serine/threonine-protein phosphatase [Streptomyces sp. H28]|uniref:PP2C family protein-serine/threonine phosphatase n=1 Tax=Streptomyces sp. H28 TaxID=2775865 RepID=UPI00177A878B|nr:PP2C family protein-serine/threonine phosphatase [Streptomyces sp. H28]MBD9731081.1 serine/threonine-protein phosphatase [Streptomyces sp. H28]